MSDLLKQAIADAKAVRATALANAKAALEEAFTPRLQSMLSTKLQQEVEDDDGTDELGEQPPAPADTAVTDSVPVPDAPAPDTGVDDVSVEAPIDAPAPEGAEGFGQAPAPEAQFPGLGGEEGGEEQLPMDEFSMEEGGTAASTVITAAQDADELMEEKASTDYKKTTSGHKTQDPQGQGKEFKDGPKKADKKETSGSLTSKGGTQKASSNYKTDPKHGGPVKNMKNQAPKTDDPQGQGNELSDGPGKADKNSTGKVLEEDDVPEETLDEILKELESEVAQDTGTLDPACSPSAGPDEMDEEIDLSSLLESDDEEKKENPFAKKKDKDKDEDKDDEKDDDKPAFLKENISLKKELQEYRNTVQYLRDRINEVNLLNAKLLYTNKLFKQAQLTNEQKLKIIEQFDLTKSVREAKLTYANLSESISFGAKSNTTSTVASAPVKKVAVVKTIAEGLASKAVGSTKPTKPAVLTEGAEMANRFKKLAGIRSSK